MNESCALPLEGEENWENLLLQGHNQGGGRRQTAPGTVNKSLRPELKWRCCTFGETFSRCQMTWRTGSPGWWHGRRPPHGWAINGRTVTSCLRCGVPRTRGLFSYPCRMIPQKNLCKLHPGTSRGYHTSNTWHVVLQKRGSVLLMDGTLIHRGAGGRGGTISFPFVPEKFCTPPNVVEPENVPDLMFVEPEVSEVGEAEEDPPATSSGSDLQPPCTTCPTVELVGAPENAPGDGGESPLHG